MVNFLYVFEHLTLNLMNGRFAKPLKLTSLRNLCNWGLTNSSSSFMGLSVNFYCHPKTLREIVNHSWDLKTDCQNFWWGVFTPE